MKLKLLFSLIAIFFLSVNATYASFPVQRTATNSTTIVEEQSDEEFTSPAAAAGSKSQVVALLLCFFLGLLGIHRFYLGYIWQGVVQLLTLGLLGIWTIIDFVRIVTGDLQPKNGSYDKTL
ncbi:TM2 domain-containing protein [Flavobacterium litorale]|uniref:TM2 domain-containing protein n=1 Tax=Flavobacterium litorale TaxID=2856519 RepID=A0ABX8V3V4_9FLAO|nr:TM2 domain-containing protein [Flavobacterium litorale]QYJ67172.1 TM2 domain-containing protein [Flavobacterium litorale]